MLQERCLEHNAEDLLMLRITLSSLLSSAPYAVEEIADRLEPLQQASSMISRLDVELIQGTFRRLTWVKTEDQPIVLRGTEKSTVCNSFAC